MAASLLATVVAVSITSGAAAGVEGDDPGALRISQVRVDDLPRVDVVASPPAELSALALDDSDFTVTEAGRERPAEVEQLPADDLDVVIAIDLAEPDHAAVRGAADELIRTLPDGSRAGLVAGPTPTDSVALTADKAQGLAGLAGLEGGAEADATTDTAAKVRAAALMADAGPGSRAAVVWISAAPATELLDRLGEAAPGAGDPVALYVVGTGAGAAPTDGAAALVAASGGRTLVVERLEQLVGATDVISRELGSQYLIQLRTEASPPAEVTVAVERDGVEAAATVDVAAAVGGTAAVAFPDDLPTPEPAPSTDAEVATSVDGSTDVATGTGSGAGTDAEARSETEADSSGLIGWPLLVALLALSAVAAGVIAVRARRRSTSDGRRRPRAISTPAPAAVAPPPLATASAPVSGARDQAPPPRPERIIRGADRGPDAPVTAAAATLDRSETVGLREPSADPVASTTAAATVAPAASDVADASAPTPEIIDLQDPAPPSVMGPVRFDAELLSAARRADLELSDLEDRLWARPDAFPLDGLVLRGAVLSSDDGHLGASPWQLFRHRVDDETPDVSPTAPVERAIDALCWAFRRASAGRLDQPLLAELLARRTGRPLPADVQVVPEQAAATRSPSLRAALVRQSVEASLAVADEDRRWLGRCAALLSLARDGALSAPILELAEGRPDGSPSETAPDPVRGTVEVIATAAGESRARLDRLIQVRVAGLAAAAGAAPRPSSALVDLVCANPIITAAFAAERLGVSGDAGLELIERLEAAQWLHRVGPFGAGGLDYWVAPGALSALEDDSHLHTSTTT